MTTPSYDGRRFQSLSNAATGEVDAQTVFEYAQRGTIVWATYCGGRIAFGTLLATMAPDGSLDMRYQHVNDRGELMTGVCRSTLEILPDGRYRLHESWQWTCGDCARGASVVEEIPADRSEPA
jgi:hypothetical protein